MFELQWLNSVEGEDPPKIFHLNLWLKGVWSKRPVIEHIWNKGFNKFGLKFLDLS